ncbi:sensor histidine kinase [Streptococcus jiangjianxini]|uniref:sensor histidine kinase n=1 Tax=Streptococcus jiangjianxini TaxID=3161189 RepID=UPI0032ED81C8
MTKKKYSMKQRSWKVVLEIIFATICNVLFILLFSTVLSELSLVTYGTVGMDFPFQNEMTSRELSNIIKPYKYDFIIFDKKSLKITQGNFVKNELNYYKLAVKEQKNTKVNLTHYAQFQTNQNIIVVRYNEVPEFSSHYLRKIPYNYLTIALFLFFLVTTVIICLTRYIKEISDNFRMIRTTSEKMGDEVLQVKDTSSQIIEFDDILRTLQEKGNDLAALIETEKSEKKDFSFQVGALAHDIKTPLTVMKGNLELLEITNLDNQQLDFVQSMNHSISTFEKYFNSMLSYSRLLIEDGNYHETIYLPEFLDDLLAEVEDMMITNRVEFSLINSTLVHNFKGNHLNLSRALINILANAARYSDGDKKVTLSVEDSSDFLIFKVWNNGRVFTNEALSNANKLFYTENAGRNNNHYGIGLSFAQKVAHNHQGKLILSNPAVGGAQVNLYVMKKI